MDNGTKGGGNKDGVKAETAGVANRWRDRGEEQ